MRWPLYLKHFTGKKTKAKRPYVKIQNNRTFVWTQSQGLSESRACESTITPTAFARRCLLFLPVCYYDPALTLDIQQED